MAKIPVSALRIAPGLIMQRVSGVYAGWDGRERSDITQKDGRQLHAARLLEWRKTAKLSQEQMADLIGLSRNHYARLERAASPITAQTHLAFCAVLGMPVVTS